MSRMEIDLRREYTLQELQQIVQEVGERIDELRRKQRAISSTPRPTKVPAFDKYLEAKGRRQNRIDKQWGDLIWEARDAGEIVATWLGRREWTFPGLTEFGKRYGRLAGDCPEGFYGDSLLPAREIEPADVQAFMIGLRELLEDAASDKRGDRLATPKKRVNQFETPAQWFWKDLQVVFTSEDRVTLQLLDKRETRNYADMGFADGRSKKKDTRTKAWKLLIRLAVNEGYLTHRREDVVRIGQAAATRTESSIRSRDSLALPDDKKDISKIRAIFKEIFSTDEDPFEDYASARGYKTRFRISIAPSFHH